MNRHGFSPLFLIISSSDLLKVSTSSRSLYNVVHTFINSMKEIAVSGLSQFLLKIMYFSVSAGMLRLFETYLLRFDMILTSQLLSSYLCFLWLFDRTVRVHPFLGGFRVFFFAFENFSVLTVDSLTSVSKQDQLTDSQAMTIIANVYYLHSDLLERIHVQFERLFNRKPVELEAFRVKVERYFEFVRRSPQIH